jgi:hypothetical protein
MLINSLHEIRTNHFASLLQIQTYRERYARKQQMKPRGREREKREQTGVGVTVLLFAVNTQIDSFNEPV